MKKRILKIIVFIMVLCSVSPIIVFADDEFDYSNFRYFVVCSDKVYRFDNSMYDNNIIYGCYGSGNETIIFYDATTKKYEYVDYVDIANNNAYKFYYKDTPLVVRPNDHPFVSSNIVIFSSFSSLEKYVDGNAITSSDVAYMPVGKTIDSNGQIVISPYTYEFSSDIPNVENLLIEKDSIYRTDWGLVVGESRSKYNVSWTPPTGNYYMEIHLQSKFDSKTRRWKYQTFDYSYPFTRITPDGGKWDFNLNTLGVQCLKVCWSDVDTGSWVAVPITEMYFRYVKLDTTTRKALHGSWARFDFASGNTGIIETKLDVVNTVEKIDPVTGEITYEDTPIDGNKTKYIGDEGKLVDEDQSFGGTMFDMQGRLNSVIDTIKDLGTMVGAVPNALASLLTFLPAPIWGLISLGIATLIAIAIWHNLRG